MHDLDVSVYKEEDGYMKMVHAQLGDDGVSWEIGLIILPALH